MVDIWRAIRNKKCPWCRHLDTGPWELFFHNGIGGRFPRFWWWVMFESPRPNIWKLGLKWHSRFHVKATT